MPRRKTYFSTGEFYHLFNRSLFRKPIFTQKRDLDIFMQQLQYYVQEKPPIKFSYYRQKPQRYNLDDKRLVAIISYCLMPTHFHMAVRQEKERGIQIFMQRLLNSFSHFYQIRHKSSGPLFESSFKSVHIETEGQLMHISRYHHLNPVTAHLVENPDDYIYSSYQHYQSESCPLWLDPSYVLANFLNIKSYNKYVTDRKDYQRELESIKHLIFT